MSEFAREKLAELVALQADMQSAARKLQDEIETLFEDTSAVDGFCQAIGSLRQHLAALQVECQEPKWLTAYRGAVTDGVAYWKTVLVKSSDSAPVYHDKLGVMYQVDSQLDRENLGVWYFKPEHAKAAAYLRNKQTLALAENLVASLRLWQEANEYLLMEEGQASQIGKSQ